MLACSEKDYKSGCNTLTFDPTILDGKTSIVIHHDVGLWSIKPSPGLSVEVWDTPDCSGDIPWRKKVMCPGIPDLDIGAVGTRIGGTRDICVRVRRVDRASLGKVAAECEFR